MRLEQNMEKKHNLQKDNFTTITPTITIRHTNKTVASEESC